MVKQRRLSQAWLIALLVAVFLIAGIGVWSVQRNLEPSYTLFAAGDTILARRAHHYYYRYGAQGMLGDVAALAADSDIALLNLETVIATQGRPWPKQERKPYYFRGMPELVDVLSLAGIDIVTTGNNHAMDYGPEALYEQQDILDAAGIASVGSGANIQAAVAPTYIKHGETVLAFVNFYVARGRIAATVDKPGVAMFRQHAEVVRQAQAAFQVAQQYADVVVFSPHWGPNMAEAPTAERRQLARQLIDMGYDAILGHSAHRIQGLEVYRGRAIVYDMGNFFADWVNGDAMRYGAVYQLHFNRRGFTAMDIYPLFLRPGRVNLATGQKAQNSFSMLKGLSRALDPQLHFENAGEHLRVNLQTRPKMRQITQPSSRVYAAGRTQILPPQHREAVANVVYQAPPKRLGDVRLASCQHGVEVLAARYANRVHLRGGFLAEVTLKVGGPLGDRWEAIIQGVNEDTGYAFSYLHPLAHGVWDPRKWQVGQVGVDQVVVRTPKDMQAGTYKLYWAMLNRDTGEKLRCVAADASSSENVLLGEITVLKTGVPKTAAGIDWQAK